MKKLFIIDLKEDRERDYDQFDSFLVRAIDKETAWNLAEELVKSSLWASQTSDYFNKDSFEINELSIDGKEEVILASYNAG
jgi:hypothetical protein